MPRTRAPYPPEFRVEAVRMLRAGVRSSRQLAAELGCSEQTLRNWWRQDEADRGDRDEVPVRRGGGRIVACLAAVPARRCDRPGLLRVEAASAERAPARRPRARRTDPRDRSRDRRDLRAPRIYS